MNSHKLIYSQKSSGQTYYFRIYIPTDLIEHFDGVRQLRVSLKCAIKSRSVKITKILKIKVSSLFEEIRMGAKSLNIEQIKEILRIEIRKQILHSHRVREGTNRWDEDGIKGSLDSIQKKELSLKDRLKSDPKSYKDEVESKLEGILKSLDVHVEKNSLEFQKLRNNFIDLYLLRHEWMRELVNQTGKSDDDFRKSAEQKLGIELFPELQESSIEDFRKGFQTNLLKTKSVEVNNSVAGKKISECAGLFYDRKTLEETSEKEIGELKRIINDFIEVMGDLSIIQINKGVVSEYISLESKLPPQRRKSAKFRDLVLKWTVGFHHKHNPSHNETGWFPKGKENWGTTIKSSTRNKTLPAKPSGAKNQMPYYWIFPLGILSGLRTNEMCQLRCSDVRKENKCPYFSLIKLNFSKSIYILFNYQIRIH